MKDYFGLLPNNYLTIQSQLSEYYPYLYFGQLNSSCQNVVIKKYSNQRDFFVELTILKKISDKNIGNKVPIPKIYGFLEQKDGNSIVMEKIESLDLISQIQSKKLSKINYLKIMKQIVNVINNLHEINIAHRDIKCDNILVTLTFTDVKLVLIDFAYSIMAASDKKAYQKLGTVNYYSPELHIKSKYNPKKNDVWSVGVVLYILATEGYYPFLYTEKIRKKSHNNCKHCLKKFYNKVAKKISYVRVDKTIISVLKKIFVPEKKRINMSQLFHLINPIIDVLLSSSNFKEDDTQISPKRHILWSTL